MKIAKNADIANGGGRRTDTVISGRDITDVIFSRTGEKISKKLTYAPK